MQILAPVALTHGHQLAVQEPHLLLVLLALHLQRLARFGLRPSGGRRHLILRVVLLVLLLGHVAIFAPVVPG